jgi:putative tryptophan/tyrosine transport system substrate-binding protein
VLPSLRKRVDVRRREFITFLAGAAVARPLSLRAEQSSRARRVGVLVNEPWPAVEGLHVGLDELGYQEGKDFHIEYRFAEGATERFAGLAAELVSLPVDVIVAWGTPAALAAHKATSSIPIVMSAGDPVGAGLISSLARPGGNVTGLSSQPAGGEEKRLVLLKELRPSLSRVAVLSNPTNPYSIIAVEHARRGAAALGLSLDVVEVSAVSELDVAFRTMREKSADAALVIADPFLAHERALVATLLVEHRLPSISAYHECAVAGGLMAYMTSYYDIFRREAIFIDKIFEGAKPGDLPIEQATKFEFVINLKTAKALGLDVPPSLLVRADRLIE